MEECVEGAGIKLRIIVCDSCGRQQDNGNNSYLATLTDEGSWVIVEASDDSGEILEYQLCSYLCLSMFAATMMEQLGEREPPGT